MEITDREAEVKKWLTVALAEENLRDFSVKITGNSEKGDGYVGDIIFVFAAGTNKQGNKKEYDIVLKCSKPSAALMENLPVIRKVFVREAYLYQNVFPVFKKFQINRGLKNLFDSVPKCYGVYSDEFRYVIALENLKKIGYDLWPKAKPLTRQVINIIIENYAKFHATSVALQQQDSEQFEKLQRHLSEDLVKEIFSTSDFRLILENTVNEIYKLLKHEVANGILEKWLTLKEQVSFIFSEMTPDIEDMQVINHGDCWVNNFLYKFENEDRNNVSKVAILDWQLSTVTSPVIDLSYFLFSGLSKEDIDDLKTILTNYYNHFCDYLIQMGSSVPSKYTADKFFDEWKKYSKFGVLMCVGPIQFFYTDKEDLPDMAEAADSGVELKDSFKFSVRDKEGFKNRIRPIVEYAVNNQLI